METMDITAVTVIDLRKSVKLQIVEDEKFLKDYFTEKQIKKLVEELNKVKKMNTMKLAFVYSVKRKFRKNKVVVKYMEKGR